MNLELKLYLQQKHTMLLGECSSICKELTEKRQINSAGLGTSMHT